MPGTEPTPERFFESLYRGADGDAESVPWAAMAPNSFISDWVEGYTGPVGDAIVVASGLGDDAEALSRTGWSVTAFDIAPTAIDWCATRFPDTTVDYVVADLFDLPAAWLGAFSLVVEVFTIQSFPPAEQLRAIQRISSLVALGGTLLVASFGRHNPATQPGPPWPPAIGDLAEFTAQGLLEVGFSVEQSRWDGFDHIEAEYRRL